jgi:hypothetical protein
MSHRLGNNAPLNREGLKLDGRIERMATLGRILIPGD